MNMFDEARSLMTIMKMRSLTQGETAKMLGVSQSYVANKLRLMKLDNYEQEKIINHRLTERHARVLLRLKPTEERHAALDRICSQQLTVAQSEALIGFMLNDSLPRDIGRGDKLKCVDNLIDKISDAVKLLSSLGIDASHRIKYYDKQAVITIYINE